MVPMPSMPKLVPHIIDWKAWAVATGMGSLETPSWTKKHDQNCVEYYALRCFELKIIHIFSWLRLGMRMNSGQSVAVAPLAPIAEVGAEPT